MRLTRISKLHDVHCAEVVEVNLVQEPSYLITEFIRGKSLAKLKTEIPDEDKEAFISKLIPDLIDTAIAIRKSGLTINNLALTGAMLDGAGSLFVLSSAIKYEEEDEREDVFTIGMIVSQFLATGGLSRLIYTRESLRENKFSYISGVTISLNKLLAECLHRNVLQRVTDLESLKWAFKNLPEISEDSIWIQKDKSKITAPEPLKNPEPPKFRGDWTFWLLISSIIVLAAVSIFMLFGRKAIDTISEAFAPSPDSLALEEYIDNPETPYRDSIRVTNYAPVRRAAERRTRRGLNEVITPPATQTPQAPASQLRAPMPSNFVYVEAGTFGFGRLIENNHNVSLSGFYLSKYELTQGEWNRFMRPANVSSPGDRMPVDNISWRQVVTYCNGRSDAEGLTRAYRITGSGNNEVITCDFNANGYRMPTEAEWEYAAKAGYLYNYSGSDEPADVAWYKGNSAGRTHQVGGKEPNAKGLYDMTGNVSEWVWDFFSTDFIRNLSSFINPKGPAEGTQRVIRGGSIINGEGRNLNILWREKGYQRDAYPYVGVRLVRTR